MLLPLHKIKTGLMLVGLIAQLTLPVLALGQQVTVEDLAPLPGQEPSYQSGDGNANHDLEINRENYNAGSSQASSQLQQTRSKDKQKCQGSKYFAGLAGKLQSTLQERLPQIIRGALMEQLPGQIQGIINEQMPEVVNQVVTEGITRELTVQIAGLINQGVNPSDISPDLIRSIIQQRLPIILLNGLQQELPRAISNGFRQLGPGILQGALGGPNGGLAADIQDELADEFNEAIDDTIGDLEDEPLSAQGRNQLGILRQNRGEFSQELVSGAIDLLTSSIGDNQMLGQFSDEMADQMEDILTQQLAVIMSQPEFRNSLNQVSDQMSASLSDQLGDLGGELSDIALDSLDDTVNEVVAQISAPISRAVSDTMTTALSAVANPINAAINGTINLITEPIVAITGGLVNGITEPFTTAMDGLVDSVVQPFSEGLTNMMNKVLSPITELSDRLTQQINDLFDNAIDQVFNILPFARVPTDALVNNNSGISIDTKVIKEVQNKACADVETAKKIAADMQKKELVDDRKAREQASKTIDKFSNQTVKLFRDEKLVLNLKNYVQEARKEAKDIALAELEHSGDTFSKQTLRTLKSDDLNDPYASTLSQSEYRELLSNPSQLNSATYWDRLLKLYDPTKNNSPGSSLLNNLAIQGQRQAAAEQNARDKYIAGQGIKEITECNKYDQDQNCIDETVITPGRVSGDLLNQVNAARVGQQVNVDELTDIVKGSEPTTELIQTLNAPGATGPGGLPNIFRLGNGQSNFNTGSNLPPINPGDLLSLIPPTARIQFTSPNLVSVANHSVPNTATLNWSLIIGDSCTAANPWLSATSATGTIQVLKRAGEEVERRGSLTLKFPLSPWINR